MSHVPQLCRQAAELVPREVKVSKRGELGYVWGDTLKEGGEELGAGDGKGGGEGRDRVKRKGGRGRRGMRGRRKREERGEEKIGPRTVEGGITLPSLVPRSSPSFPSLAVR